MKLALAILVYLIMALALGWGLLLAVHGNWWLLAAGVLAYVIAFVKLGCWPGKSH